MTATINTKSPAEWAAAGDPYDCSGLLGDLFPPAEPPAWPMYSYSRPSSIVWNAIAANLHKRGWSDAKIKEWLQSRKTRWALDMSLGEELAKVADAWATKEI